jgi:diguanylate cyclase (GGDEF)-like protein
VTVVSIERRRRFGRSSVLRPGQPPPRGEGGSDASEDRSLRASAVSGLRGRIVAVVLALALVLLGLLLYGAFRSAASEASSKLRAQTTLQLARARVDLGSDLSQSNSQLYLSGKLLQPQARSRAHVYVTRRGALRLVRSGGTYRLERDLVVGSGAAPLVRLHEQLRVDAALLDGLGQPKVDAGALGVLSRHGVVIAGDQALLGRRLPASGSVTIAGKRYSVGSSPLDTAASLQVLVPEAKVRAQLASTHWKLLGGGAVVLLALVVCLYVLGRPLWRSLGEVIQAADATDDASTDDLTGLASRRVFRMALAFEFERAKRYQTPLSLVLLDLDDFKQIENSYGGPAGDEALRSFADVITGALPADGLAARTSREEFALLLPDTDLAGAAELGERVRAALEEADVRYGHAIFSVTTSVGVATSVAATLPQQLLQEAHDALFRAKAAGKNRVEPAAPQPVGS